MSGEPLPESEFVLSRMMKKHGFATAGFVGGPFLKSKFGFSQGFDNYDDTWNGIDQRANQINVKVFKWLKKNASNRFFLFINYFDPHAPYNPPEDFESPFKGGYDGDINFAKFGPHQIKLQEIPPLDGKDRKRAIDLYDSEILFLDTHIGRLFGRLESLGRLEDTLIIITSDHGEGFGQEEIWGHGALPIENQIHVPLIIHCPMQMKAGRTVIDQVQITSIYSTILDSAGIPLPHFVEQTGFGINLLRAGEEGDDTPLYTFAERFLPKKYKGMLRSNRWKYMEHRVDTESNETVLEYVFDLEKDPRETRNLFGVSPRLDASLRSKYAYFQERISEIRIRPEENSEGSAKMLDDKTREELKALGYVK